MLNGGLLTVPWNSFISENPIVAKIQYWMKITFVFILILFIDSINRVYRVQADLIAAKNNENSGYVSPQWPPYLPSDRIHSNRPCRCCAAAATPAYTPSRAPSPRAAKSTIPTSQTD